MLDYASAITQHVPEPLSRGHPTTHFFKKKNTITVQQHRYNEQQQNIG